MKEHIEKLEPRNVWRHFYALTQIPRPSKHEAAAIEYIRAFAEQQGLEYHIDEVGNIVIRKKATSDKEQVPGVILQGHIDMVPQKNSDVNHDFLKDPIQPYIDGEWVKAQGTTLGADNGIGVAVALSILEEKTLEHGPVEVLITVDEETGMTGALALKPGFVKGNILINLDSEDEGELYIGCAGGIDTEASWALEYETCAEDVENFKIEIKGLRGGHSGLDIHLGRANANKILGRILWNCYQSAPFRLSHIEGGTLRNAIPREASAVISIHHSFKQVFEQVFTQIANAVIYEYQSTDPDISIQFTAVEKNHQCLSENFTTRIINAINGSFDGIVRLSPDMPDVVETSTNMGVIKMTDKDVIIASLQRSSVDSAKIAVAHSLRSLYEACGAQVRHYGDYPGWKPDVQSQILNLMKQVYQQKYGTLPAVKVIHAGLECGIIQSSLQKKLDMISCGPTIRFPHSPDEKVYIPSVQRFYEFLTETLKHIVDWQK